MLMRTDPFRDFDRLTETLFGTRARPQVVPLTAYRDDDAFIVHLDPPAVDPESIDVTVEQNVLTVHAEREAPAEGTERLIDERHYGVFERQLILGDVLDLEQLSASFDHGVLTIRIPVSAKTQARKIEIAAGTEPKELVG